MFELIISDGHLARQEACLSKVSHASNGKRTLISEALMHIGWGPSQGDGELSRVITELTSGRFRAKHVFTIKQ